MTATNICSNFGGKWDSPPSLTLKLDLIPMALSIISCLQKHSKTSLNKYFFRYFCCNASISIKQIIWSANILFRLCTSYIYIDLFFENLLNLFR